jgi:GNAT superfamily N-acetyltransferase
MSSENFKTLETWKVPDPYGAYELYEIQQNSPFSIRLAETADIPRFRELRQEAAAWILQKSGIPQWSKNVDETFRRTIDAGETFAVDTLKDGPIATITVSQEPDPSKWDVRMPWVAQKAIYLSKFCVARSCSGMGLGSDILEFTDHYGYDRGAYYARLDAWTANQSLHEYYAKEYFGRVGTAIDTETVSGALFERELSPIPYLGMHINNAENFLVSRSYP